VSPDMQAYIKDKQAAVKKSAWSHKTLNF
jgi:hypothetical protein